MPALPFRNLPLAPRNRPWNESKALQRVKEWATSDGSGDEAQIDWAKFRRAFFWYDPNAAKNIDGYHLLFCDVIDGVLTASPRGIRAAGESVKGRQERGGMSGPLVAAIRAQISRYYRKMSLSFHDRTIVTPWRQAEQDAANARLKRAVSV